MKKIAYIGGLIVLLITVVIAAIIFINIQDLPTIDTQLLNQYKPTTIYDKDNNVIYKDPAKRFDPISYQEIPKLYVDTLVAVEDQSYWQNNGVSILGIGNMLFSSVKEQFDSNTQARGGSTITQQLIKNVYLDKGRSSPLVKRKIQEIFLAIQLNDNFSKEDILTFYVNHIEYNEGSTGLKAIMKTYFGKEPSDYNERSIPHIAQIAYLVGLGQAPTTFNLYHDPQKAHERMKTVLYIMHQQKLITDDEYQNALQYDLTKDLKPRYWEQEEQRVVNLQYLPYTQSTLNEMRELGYDIDKLSVQIKTHLDTNVYNHIKNMARNLSYVQDDQQQIALTVMAHDGRVIAMVGSRDDNDEYNRAVQQTRSSGSSMKPFTAYGPLLEYFGDKYNTGSTISGANYVYPGTNTVMYNYGRAQYGNVDLQRALRLSLNTTVARIDDEILGSNHMKQFLKQNGLDTHETYSSLEGIGINISTLQSAAAYNSMSNYGTFTQPRFIDTITFSDNSTKTVVPRQHQSMSTGTAFALLQMLRGVPQTNGTAIAAVIPEYKGYAGKTGLVGFADNINPPAPYGLGSSDSWYTSTTHQGYTVSVWTGYDQPNTSPQISDSNRGVQRLNKDIQLYLNQNNPKAKENWSQPETVTKLSGNDLSAVYKVNNRPVTIHSTYVNIDLLTQLENAQLIIQSTTPKDWKINMSPQDKTIYQLNTFDVLDQKTFNTITGSR